MEFELLGLSLFSLLLSFFFIALAIIYFSLLNTVDVNSKKILFSLRLFTLLFLIILLLDPWINWQNRKISNQELNIYIDNSKSMELINPPLNFDEKIKFIDNWSISNKVPLNWYLFGDSIRPFKFKDNLFSDNYTSLNGLKETITFNHNANHLIISDGHINKDEKFDNIKIDNNNIYIAGFGDEINKRDCYISSVIPYDSTDSLFCRRGRFNYGRLCFD